MITNREHQPLSGFRHDATIGRDLAVAVTVKTTFQVHKNDQLDGLKRRNEVVLGREQARPHVRGFVAGYSFDHDQLSWDLREAEWAFSAVEPYCVDSVANWIAVTSGNIVVVIDTRSGTSRRLTHPWLTLAHSVQFSTDGRRLLVCSAGFDCALEFDVATFESTWEWDAWDRGYCRSSLGHAYARSEALARDLLDRGVEVRLVLDPHEYPFGIPTRFAPVHLNCARYSSRGDILLTLFHQGCALVVDRVTDRAVEACGGMRNPHKLAQRRDGGYFVSDTRNGALVLLDRELRSATGITLEGLPGCTRQAHLGEFLQNTTEVGDGVFACIDIHRSTIWLVDAGARRYRGICFPVEWSVHDVALFAPGMGARIEEQVGRAFGRVVACAEDRTISHFEPDGELAERYTLDRDGRQLGHHVMR